MGHIESPQIVECRMGSCTAAEHVDTAIYEAGVVRVAIRDGEPVLHAVKLSPSQSTVGQTLHKPPML